MAKDPTVKKVFKIEALGKLYDLGAYPQVFGSPPCNLGHYSEIANVFYVCRNLYYV